MFCAAQFGGVGFGEGNASIGDRLLSQGIGVLATITYMFIMSCTTLILLDAIMGLRVSAQQEEEGLDLALHDERGYII